MKKYGWLLVYFALPLIAKDSLLEQAENHRKAKEYESALLCYGKKLASGGSENELFWAYYSIGLTQEKLKAQKEKVTSSYYKAYQYCPLRAEPLFKLSQIALRDGYHLIGYLLSKFALSLPVPQEPLYRDLSVYDYGLKKIYADCCFFLGKYLEAQDEYTQILQKKNLPRDVYQAAYDSLLKTTAQNEWERRAYEGEAAFEKYKDKRLDLIAQFLPESPVIFEAGAHYGNDTLSFIKKWPKAKILAFEPNPAAFAHCTQKTKDHPSILRFNLAVSDRTGEAALHLPYNPSDENTPLWQTGASSLLKPMPYVPNIQDLCTVEVPCVVLDLWCEQNHIPRIDFMWLDLEGLELPVLKSSPKILENVSVIYTETNFQEMRSGTTQYHSLKKFLENAGFKLAAHWYAKNLQGDALFVKNEVYREFISKNKLQ